MGYQQTVADLERHLADEFGFLVDACERYDEGKFAYSKQIATSLRKLIHHTNRSHALLTQLGVRDEWRWKDTSEEIDPLNVLSTFGLVKAVYSLHGGDETPTLSWHPFLEDFPKQEISRTTAFSARPVFRQRGTPMLFKYWWNRAIMRDLARNNFSRKDLVLGVSNTDGGAHIDPTIADAFAALTRRGSLSLGGLGPDGTMATSSPVPASIRQIGFEVVATMLHYQPELGSRRG